MPAGAVLAVDDEQVELLARSRAAPRGGRCRPAAARSTVYGPHENQRVTSGSPASSSSAGASSRRGQAQGQRGTMQRDAGAAVRHPRQPTGAGGRARRRPRGRRRRATCSGATTPCSAAGPPRRSTPPARAAPTRPGSAATPIAGRRPSPPDGEPARSGVAGLPRAAGRRDASPSSARCPRAPASARGTRAWHASPEDRPASFWPEPGDDERELLEGVARPRAWSSATSTSPSSASARTGSSSSRPGAVGIPLDGDHRAAWALMHDDGRIERRRVAYDHAASAARVREVADGAPWGDVVAGRIERAGLE